MPAETCVSDCGLRLGKHSRAGAEGAAASNGFPGARAPEWRLLSPLFKRRAVWTVVEARAEGPQDPSVHEDCSPCTVGAQLLLRPTRQPSVAGRFLPLTPDQLPDRKAGMCRKPVLREGRCPRGLWGQT